MSDLEDAYRAGWLRGNVVVGCEPDWVDEDWVAYRDAREINRTQAERDAEVRAEGGDGTPEQPFRATYNPKCFQRHDAELYAKICERDDGFEITVIPPRTGPTRHYRIDATGSWADLARPGEDKTLPLEMLLSIAGVSEPAATETTTEFCARIAAKYGYKVEEP